MKTLSPAPFIVFASVFVPIGFLSGQAGTAPAPAVTGEERNTAELSGGHYERPTKRSSNYRENVILFVHGLFGDANTTWKSSNGAYWPRLLLSDPAFDSYDVYVAQYDTPKIGNTMTVDEIVASLNNRLAADSVFSKHQRVIWVCHSLGGVVAERFLLTFRQYDKNTPLLYLFAVPDEGSQIANIAKHFSSDRLLQALFYGDENGYLLNLENEWRAAGLLAKRLCAYEKKPLGPIGLIVDRLSATRHCDLPPVPINEDHISIVKPSSTRADSYTALKVAITDLALFRASSLRPIASSVSTTARLTTQKANTSSPIEALTDLGWSIQRSIDRPMSFTVSFSDLPSLDLSSKQFHRLTRDFSISLIGVTSIDGIELLSDISLLKSLEINGAGEKQYAIDRLKSFTKLESLGLTQTPINNVSALQNLKSLKTLRLHETQVVDISVLSNLKELSIIGLGGSPVRDLSALQNLSKLSDLNVRDTLVTDLSPLANLKQLSHLEIDSKQVLTLDKLQPSSLRKLDIIDVRPFDSSTIGSFSRLEDLFIWGPQVLDLSFLRKMASLLKVRISPLLSRSVMHLIDIEAIGSLPQLETLGLSSAGVSDLSFISALPALQSLSLAQMRLDDLVSVAKIKSLRSISFLDVSVPDLSPLLQLPNLHDVTLNRVSIKSDVVLGLQHNGVIVRQF